MTILLNFFFDIHTVFSRIQRKQIYLLEHTCTSLLKKQTTTKKHKILLEILDINPMAFL